MKRIKGDVAKGQVLEAELVDEIPGSDGSNPTQTINLKLARSKKYIKSILDMPADEAMKFLGDQMTTIMMLANEQMLKWLEILDGETNPKVRMEAAHHINNLMTSVTQISETRIKLQIATGMDKLAGLGLDKPKLHKKDKDISPEEFMAKYSKLMPNVEIQPTKDPKQTN